MLLIISVVLLAAYLLLAAAASPRPQSNFIQQLPRDGSVFAHAGGNLLWPDNTLTAFEGATSLGADVLELDVYQASDGVFVAIHDDTVDRTTDGTGAVAALGSNEIAQLDAGFYWTTTGTHSSPQANADFPYRGQGISVPTLAQVLTAFPEKLINIELKQDDAQAGRALCMLLAEHDAKKQMLMMSNYSASIRGFRSDCQEVATGASRQEVIVFYLLARSGLHRLYSPPFDALQIPVAQGGITVVTPGVVRAAHDRGVQVHVWTINETDEMKRLFTMGIDGVITDRPDRALRVLEREFPKDVLPAFVNQP